jgi:hypothetical protein
MRAAPSAGAGDVVIGTMFALWFSAGVAPNKA